MRILKLLKSIFTKTVSCDMCKGHGLMADHKWRYFDCLNCKGKGELTINKFRKNK